ncbi:hypothetical protein Tco_0523525 [Tanacetum coccineum]
MRGSPIPIGDGDGDVNRFPDWDGDGDGDEAEKQGWGSFSSREKVFLGVLVKGERQDFGAKCGALTNKCGELGELMR